MKKLKPLKVTVTDWDGVVLQQIEVDINLVASEALKLRKRRGLVQAAAALMRFAEEACDEIHDEIRRAIDRELVRLDPPR